MSTTVNINITTHTLYMIRTALDFRVLEGEKAGFAAEAAKDRCLADEIRRVSLAADAGEHNPRVPFCLAM